MSKLEIPIDAMVLHQMYEYAAYAELHFNAEIAGWGHYSKKDGIYKLAPLLPQIVSGAEVDTFPDQIVNNKDYDMSDMIVQWHSHVNMATIPSGTDKQLILDALELFPMLISIIVNCQHEYSARLDVRKIGADHCMVNLDNPTTYEVDLLTYYDNPKVNKEVLKKLRKPKPVEIKTIVQTNYEHHHDGYNWRYNWDEYEPPTNPQFSIYKCILEKASSLEEDFPDEYSVYEMAGGSCYIRCASTNTTAIVRADGEIEIDGMVNDWKGFLEATGAVEFSKYHM